MIYRRERIMSSLIRISILLLCLLPMIAGVSAFSITSITYTIENDGNGTVDLQYQLNGSEKLQYDLITNVLDIKTIGKEELEKSIHREVTVSSLTPESVKLSVLNLASVNGNIITTPSFTYVPVESLVDPSLLWIVEKFDINFIPHNSIITFPDGYTESFTDAETIPEITHSIQPV